MIKSLILLSISPLAPFRTNGEAGSWGCGTDRAWPPVSSPSVERMRRVCREAVGTAVVPIGFMGEATQVVVTGRA